MSATTVENGVDSIEQSNGYLSMSNYTGTAVIRVPGTTRLASSAETTVRQREAAIPRARRRERYSPSYKGMHAEK